jgi:putative membrane protein
MKAGSYKKIHKKMMKAVAVTTAFALLLPVVLAGWGARSAAAAAKENPTKSETVYANLDSAGKTRRVIVSNWLHDDIPGAVIADRSQLSDIVNIKGIEKPEISGDNVTWTLSGNDLYYQGHTAKELPVSMTLRYFLNGEAVSPSDLAGKSGKFELKISFHNHEAHSVTVGGRRKTVYTPFVCMAAFNLPQKNFSNVTTNFGNVISDGNNQALGFIGFPGLKQSLDMIDFSSVNLPDELNVTADVKDFSLGPVMMTAVPAPDMDSLKKSGDLKELAAQLNRLIDAGAQLNEAAGTLNAGEKAFADGVRQLLDGVNTAGASFDQIVNGAGTLNSTVSDAQKGVPALIKGTNSLAAGADQVSGGLGRLSSQFGAGSAASPTLRDSIGSLDGGARQLAGGLEQLLAQLSPAESGQPATLADSVGALNSGATQYTELTNNALFGLAETNLQTIRAALSSALQGQPSEVIAQAVTTAVSQELTGLHGAADAAIIQYLTSGDPAPRAAYFSNACAYINLYDILNIVANSGGTSPTEKEAAFEQAMKSAASGAPSSYLYLFDKNKLSVTLAATSLTSEQQNALQAAAVSLPDASIQALVKTINAQNVVLAGDQVSGGTSALAAQFKATVSGQGATLYDSVKRLNDGAQQLKDGADALSAQTVSSGDPSHPSLCDSIAALDEGAESLASGAKALSSGASGLSALQSGVGSLYEALGLFSNGYSTIQGGASSLNDHAQELAKGTTALDNGMSRFWEEGLSKLQSVDTNKMEQAIAVKDEMIKLADGYSSFTGSGDGITSSVKFILKTDEIKATAEPEAQAPSPSASQNLGFWERIVHWFRDLFRAD